MPNDLEKILEQAESNLKRELDWIGRHDTRSAFAAGISIAMLGVLANASAAIVRWDWWIYSIFGIAAGLFFVSLVLVYSSQYPKTESRNSSLIFFGTVAALRFDEFAKKFKEMDREQYLDDLLYQVHINAEILDKKFRYLKYSLRLLAIAIIPWLIAIYLSKLYLK